MARKTVIAIVAAAAFVACIVAAFGVLAALKNPVVSSSVLLLAASSFIGAAFVSATAGLLWHVIALKFRLTGIVQYMAAGALIAAPFGYYVWGFALVLSDLTSESALVREHYFLVGTTSILGACAAATAWLIRRPDRDAAKPAQTAP